LADGLAYQLDRIAWAGALALKQLTRTSVDNWAIGNFSDAAVRGEIRSAAIQQEVYGLVELIM
jgi:hypothetical protein